MGKHCIVDAVFAEKNQEDVGVINWLELNLRWCWLSTGLVVLGAGSASSTTVVVARQSWCCRVLSRSSICRFVPQFCLASMSASNAMTQLSMPWLELRHAPPSLPGVGGLQVAAVLLLVSTRQDLS